MENKALMKIKDPFGDRVEICFNKENLKPSERRYRSMKVTNVMIDVYRSLLGREPTEEEILGIVDISKASSNSINLFLSLYQFAIRLCHNRGS